MLKVPDVLGPLVVGQTYLVDCVKLPLVQDNSKWRWFPVLCDHVGDLSHQYHIHFDHRFMSRRDRYYRFPLISAFAPNNERSWRPRKCRQQHITTHVGADNLQWHRLQRILMERGAQINMKCMKCPHQGVDLQQAIPIVEGGREVLVCPAHFMAYDAHTGHIVERPEPCYSRTLQEIPSSH